MAKSMREIRREEERKFFEKKRIESREGDFLTWFVSYNVFGEPMYVSQLIERLEANGASREVAHNVTRNFMESGNLRLDFESILHFCMEDVRKDITS